MTSATAHYQQTQVMTSSRVQLIVLLYDGAIQAMQLAQDSIRRNNQLDKARFLRRAVNIISELSAVLDMERGGAIAGSLRRLYEYMLAELLQANLRHRADHLDGPVRCLTTMRGAWQTLVERGETVHADSR